jgi:Tol biopolymer transport system component
MPVLAVSRDGKQFAYCTEFGIYVCTGNPARAKLLAGTKGSTMHPCFSPDGSWIVYWSRNEGVLRKIPVAGGNPVPLRGVNGPISGVHWSADNAIVYSLHAGNILQVSANGKNPRSLLSTDYGTVFPQILPDRQSLLYSISRSGELKDARIMVASVKSGETKELCAGLGAWYLPSGHLVYRSPDNTVLAVPFNLVA